MELWHIPPYEAGRMTLPDFFMCVGLVEKHKRAAETRGAAQRGRR